MERGQDVLVVRLRDVLLELRDESLRGCNNDVPSVRLQDDLSKSQMKHPTTYPRRPITTSLQHLL